MNQVSIVLPARTQRNYVLHIMSHITEPDVFRCISHHPQGSHIRTLGKQLKEASLYTHRSWNRSYSVFCVLSEPLV
jgi:hypothetical protein